MLTVRMRRIVGLIFILGFSVLFASCATTSAQLQKKSGFEKRDALVQRVERARDSQFALGEQVQVAVAELGGVVALQGTDMELKRKFRALVDEVRRCEKEAINVKSRIATLEETAETFLTNWETELAQYTTESIRLSSQETLQATRAKYDTLITAMRAAEGKIEPVLAKLRDHILFLQHDLNVPTITGLKEQVAALRSEVGDLRQELEHSVNSANMFIQGLTVYAPPAAPMPPSEPAPPPAK